MTIDILFTLCGSSFTKLLSLFTNFSHCFDFWLFFSDWFNPSECCSCPQQQLKYHSQFCGFDFVFSLDASLCWMRLNEYQTQVQMTQMKGLLKISYIFRRIKVYKEWKESYLKVSDNFKESRNAFGLNIWSF